MGATGVLAAGPVGASRLVDARGPLPEAARRLRVGMPHLDAGGLSEGWLLRYAGDLHWEAIGRQLGVATDDIRTETGERLYPTVIALRARYGAPLAAVQENDALAASIEVVPCGRACAHGRFSADIVSGNRYAVEILTSFALQDGAGGLKMAMPAPPLAARWRPVGLPPAIAQLAKAARRGEPLDDPFCGPAFDLNGAPAPPRAQLVYEPSPYADYNGAGLLYFASYVTIADTAERKLVDCLGLGTRRPGARGGAAVGLDWALATSAVRRDVFFYANLPLGEALAAELVAFEPEGEVGVKTRMRLRRTRDKRVIADIVTRRRWRAGSGRPAAPPGAR